MYYGVKISNSSLVQNSSQNNILKAVNKGKNQITNK